MSQVYHLVVHWGEKKSDLYFEDKDTAERIADFISLVAKDSPIPLHFEAIEQEVYSRETTIEKVTKMLNFGLAFGPN
jgi:hypothetical protein